MIGKFDARKAFWVFGHDGAQQAELAGVPAAMRAHGEVQPQPKPNRAAKSAIPLFRKAARRIHAGRKKSSHDRMGVDLFGRGIVAKPMQFQAPPKRQPRAV